MQSSNNLSLTEIITLSHLYNQQTHTPSELAVLLKVKTQSMSEVLVRLQKLHLIQKNPAEDDKRKTAITLTSNGRQLVEQTRQERDEWLINAIKQQLDEDEKKLLAKAVLLIEKIAEQQK